MNEAEERNVLGAAKRMMVPPEANIGSSQMAAVERRWTELRPLSSSFPRQVGGDDRLLF